MKVEAKVELIPKASEFGRSYSGSRGRIPRSLLRLEKSRTLYDIPLLAAVLFI